MTFSMTVNLAALGKETRWALDAKITAILGGMADDAISDREDVWRKYGTVMILDDTNTKTISGTADIGTVEALCTAVRSYGCTA